MIRATLVELSWYVRVALAAMLSVSDFLEVRVMSEHRLRDLRDERPDLAL
jgi:hypothetical protein